MTSGCAERASSLLTLKRTLISWDQGPHFWPQSTLITSVKASSPSTATLGLGLQDRNLGGTINIHVTAITQVKKKKREREVTRITCPTFRSSKSISVIKRFNSKFWMPFNTLARHPVFSSWSSPLSPSPISQTLGAQAVQSRPQESREPLGMRSIYDAHFFSLPLNDAVESWMSILIPRMLMVHSMAVHPRPRGKTRNHGRHCPPSPVWREGNCQLSADFLLKSPKLNLRTCLNFVLLPERKRKWLKKGWG